MPSLRRFSLLSLTLIAGHLPLAAQSPAIEHPAYAPWNDNGRIGHEQLVAKARAGRIDLYFLGDSITRRWGSLDYPEFLTHWQQTFTGWNAGNFGWGGDGTQQMLWRIQNGELDGVNPKVIVILAGTNNIGKGDKPGRGEQAAEGVAALIRACQAKAPGTKIILNAIFPRNDSPLSNAQIREANRRIAQLADGENVFFLDITGDLADADGTLYPGMTVDQLHLSLQGYQVWARHLTPLLEKLLGPRADDDRAPAPTGDPSAPARAAEAPGSNPLFRDRFTADPAPLVVGDTVYLYVGHDEAKGEEMFNITEWLCYSSKDLKTWQAHGPIMRPTDFAWAVRDAWASQVVAHQGKYYLYTTVRHGEPEVGMAIGVAVSDSPTGPFVDARGTALVTDRTTPGPYGWDDIDPTVLIDDDGTAWLAWGNPTCYLAKLKPNLIELEGPIQRLPLPNYTEGPWLSKRAGTYYLAYPAFAHQGLSERICYATAPAITGPWTYQGLLMGAAKNSYTIHPGILNDFNGQSYLFYHDASLNLPDGQTGGLGRRAVRAEYLHYRPDGTIVQAYPTTAGLSIPPVPPVMDTPPPADLGPQDPHLQVAPITNFYPTAWPLGAETWTVVNPFAQTSVATGLNQGNARRFGQTFVPHTDFTFGRICLYAGDGFATAPDRPLTFALYDLGPAEASAAGDHYETTGPNLLGPDSGARIAYGVQAPGTLEITWSGPTPIKLRADHRYVLEIAGERGQPTLYWRRSRADLYPAGAAYRDRQLLREKDGATSDFALALYPAE